MERAAWPWPDELTPAAARALQEAWRDRVRPSGAIGEVHWIAGVDVAFPAQGSVSRGAAVLFRYPDLAPVAGSIAELPTRFPYVPGLLSFRELPALLAALKGLPETPDLILVDGQGIAHPRRLGVASHLGVALDRPTIGVAKSVLCGHYVEPGPEAGHRSPLLYRGEVIGSVLRSRRNVRPLIISPGHRVGLEESVGFVQSCLRGYRLPEPTRLADKLAGGKGGAVPLGEGVPIRARGSDQPSERPAKA